MVNNTKLLIILVLAVSNLLLIIPYFTGFFSDDVSFAPPQFERADRFAVADKPSILPGECIPVSVCQDLDTVSIRTAQCVKQTIDCAAGEICSNGACVPGTCTPDGDEGSGGGGGGPGPGATSIFSEEYLLRVNDVYTETGFRSLTDLGKWDDGSWIEFCSSREVGDLCDIGDITLQIDAITNILGGERSVLIDAVSSGTALEKRTDKILFVENSVSGEEDDYFVASMWNGEDLIEGHLLRARDIHENGGNGADSADIERWKNGGWELQCNDLEVGDDCYLGDISIEIDAITNILGGERSVLIDAVSSGTALEKRTDKILFVENSVSGEEDDYFVASMWNGEDLLQDYLLRARDIHDEGINDGRNTVTLERWKNGGWIEICQGREVGDLCDIGDITLQIDAITNILGGERSVLIDAVSSGTALEKRTDKILFVENSVSGEEDDYFVATVWN